MSGHRALLVAVCAVSLVGAAHRATPATCVPARAVDYRAGAWYDDAGAVVLVAAEEDSYDWCAR